MLQHLKTEHNVETAVKPGPAIPFNINRFDMALEFCLWIPFRAKRPLAVSDVTGLQVIGVNGDSSE